MKVATTITKYVGYEVTKVGHQTRLHASAYIENFGKRFEVYNAKLRNTPVAKTVLLDDPLSKLSEDKRKYQSLLEV